MNVNERNEHDRPRSMTVAKSLPSYVESTAPRNSCAKRSTIFAVAVEVSVVVKKHQIMIQVSACLLASMPLIDYVNRSFRRLSSSA